MAKGKAVNSSGAVRKTRAATTPEARENQLISLAVDCAEQQLRDGTASSQVITHFLKLGTEKARIEVENLKLQKDLTIAKTEKLKSDQRIEELFEDAMKAFKTYNGQGDEDEYEDEDY